VKFFIFYRRCLQNGLKQADEFVRKKFETFYSGITSALFCFGLLEVKNYVGTLVAFGFIF
jgi:hypothetical protein